MSKKDTVTKAFMRENTVFADAFNYLIFNGKKVIQPERLQELDTTELVQLIAKGKNNKNESVQKYRDILKAAVIMEDENADYLLLGIENQTEIHYAMPVRNMIYDALQYGNQVAAIAAQNVKEKKAPTRAEFLSGFYKADKLRPVITLVLHFGADPWDGATSLHEMMDFPLEEMRTFIQDYKIHLIDPAALEPDELEKFSTSLREVLGCIKYSKDKEKLYKAGHYLGIIGMFAVGAAVGGHLILLLHERTIWVSCGLLFVGFLLMFIKEELEEHPRILEEEQEIRKNIQNIREETKTVENIIKEDLKK